MPEGFFSTHNIDDAVSFRPMYRHQTLMGIADDTMSGTVIAVRFTKAKVFYDILDDYRGVIFDNVDSCKVWVESKMKSPLPIA